VAIGVWKWQILLIFSLFQQSHGGRFEMRDLFARDTQRALLRGFGTSIIGAFPQGAIRLSTYELCKNFLVQEGVDSPFVINSISAIAGDLSSSIVKVPREVITQRVQTSSQGNATHVISDIWRREGTRGFFQGGVSTSLRDIPFMVILFSCYEEMKKRGIPKEGELTSLQSTLFGGSSGAFAGFLTTPVDVVKTRIMTHVKDTNPESKTISYVAKEILRDNGFRGFFIGAVPRSVWWFAVCSIFFPTYEGTKQVLRNLSGTEHQ
jgi:solute carrier family 25 S-adenosylmethionine transporter 26